MDKTIKENKEAVGLGSGIVAGTGLYMSLNNPTIVIVSCAIFAVAVGYYVYNTLKKS